MNKTHRLITEYTFTGFRPLSVIQIHPQKPGARIITLKRRQKKLYAAVVEQSITHSTTDIRNSSGTWHALMPTFILK